MSGGDGAYGPAPSSNPAPASTTPGYGYGSDPYNMYTTSYFGRDRKYIDDLLKGTTPFASNQWGDLIGQLQMRASGQGPSLAQQNYNMANQNTVNNLTSMAKGSASPEAAREAMIQQGRLGQGQAAGLALAGTQEQQAAQDSLTKALSGRDSLNQAATLDLIRNKLGITQNMWSGSQGQELANNQASAQQYQAAASTLALIAMLA